MLTATISGRLGKDAELKNAGQSQVLSFSVATDIKEKSEKRTLWVDVQMWGARGVAIAPYLTKGKFVVASGRMSTREHNGKTYLRIDANEIDLGPSQGGSRKTDDTPPEDSGYHTTTYDDAGKATTTDPAADDDSIPF